MEGPDQYKMDDDLMGELGDEMDDYDSKKAGPVVIEITIHPHGKSEEKEPDGDEGMPTPEELDELEKAFS